MCDKHITTTARHDTGTAESSFAQKNRLGHRTGWSPCAHSMGKFFLWLVGFFPRETSAPARIRSPGKYLYYFMAIINYVFTYIYIYFINPLFNDSMLYIHREISCDVNPLGQLL